ncbi:hypothetical protein [Amycolatopsis viridis]|uniref:Uncharacterized protein n=1 Tax=Amycolatopsis viridis TaxID=185678 RepID=A0ABX0SPA6_9PSEU|nr:hypothetical protein [Amycolatopsis viridis]NIH78797.1 hypothetical protein [Amycolatopsis viridis]
MGTYPLNSLSEFRPASGLTSGCVTDLILINGTGEMMYRPFAWTSKKEGWRNGYEPPVNLRPGEFGNCIADYGEFWGQAAHVQYYVNISPLEEPGDDLETAILNIYWSNFFGEKNKYELRWEIHDRNYSPRVSRMIMDGKSPTPVQGFDSQGRTWNLEKHEEKKNSDSFGKSHETNGRTCVAFTVGSVLAGPDWVDLWGAQSSSMCDIYEDGLKQMGTSWKSGDIGAALGNVLGWIANNCHNAHEQDTSQGSADWADLGESRRRDTGSERP